MERDAKLGYGFLLVGAALSYLADKLFGPITALVLATVVLIVGIIFLISAHHKPSQRKLIMTIWLFTLYGAGIGGLGGGIVGAITHLRSKEPSKQPDADVAHPPLPTAPLQSVTAPSPSIPQSPSAKRKEPTGEGHFGDMDKDLLPFLQVRIVPDGTARITDKGRVSITDLRLDGSTHVVDMPNPPAGQENTATPTVTNSFFSSNSLPVTPDPLNPGDTAQFDLGSFVKFNAIPDTPESIKATSQERYKEIFSSFFVFRLTFRHVGTGEKYACFKIHGSYLKYPSAVDDNASFAGSPSMMRFYKRLTDTIFAAARERYSDGAKEVQCEN